MSQVHETPAAEPIAAAAPEAGQVQLPTPTPLADCSPAEQAERRYLAAISPLLSEAYDQGSMETFVDVLTWTLAKAIVGIDKPWVTGDILRRIGSYTCRLVDSNRAQAEAKAAKEEGHVPH